MQIEAISYGAIITRVLIPDREGRLDDVVLGFRSIGPYLEGRAYFGAAIGRVAGRISNGTFTLDGRSYDLVRNDGPNHLHGGILGFDKKIWDVEATRNENGEPSLVFLCTSFDGEEAFCEGWSECGDEENPDNTYGSRHYVSQLRAKNELGNTRAMILATSNRPDVPPFTDEI